MQTVALLHITDSKELGKGMSGITYNATFEGKPYVIKLPVALLSQGRVVTIRKNGELQYQKELSNPVYRDAVQNLQQEWNNNQACLRLHTNHPDSYYLQQLFYFNRQVPFLLSERFEGSLLDWARQNQTAEEVWTVAMPQIAAGLRYMHTIAHMAHLDIKPANMLFHRTSASGVLCVLSDFGDCLPYETPTRDITGTEAYMAPELLDAYDHSLEYVPKFQDAFAFALSMLHMLCPHIPFKEEPRTFQTRLKQALPPFTTAERASSWCNQCMLIWQATHVAERYLFLEQIWHNIP
jgi:serine/threonine protein kinase